MFLGSIIFNPRITSKIPSSFACIWLLGVPRPAWLQPSSTAQGAVLKPGVVMAYGGFKGGEMVGLPGKMAIYPRKLDNFRGNHGMWGYKTHSSQQIGRPTMRTTTIGTLMIRRRVMIMICLFCDVTIKVHLSIHIVISPFEFEILHGIFT